MKKRNKLAALLLSGTMAVSLAACGGSSSASTETAAWLIAPQLRPRLR